MASVIIQHLHIAGNLTVGSGNVRSLEKYLGSNKTRYTAHDQNNVVHASENKARYSATTKAVVVLYGPQPYCTAPVNATDVTVMIFSGVWKSMVKCQLLQCPLWPREGMVGRSSILLSRFLVRSPRAVGMTGGLRHREKHLVRLVEATSGLSGSGGMTR